MKIYLYYIGKARDTHANAMAADYMKRSARYTKCEMREIHPKKFDPWAEHASASKILLDPLGKPMATPAFVQIVERGEREGRDLVFIIGGHEGLPPEWRPRADLLLGLSALTLPHELARVMLAEQIYRALTTLRGHPYPR